MLTCDYCTKKFRHKPVLVVAHVLLLEMRFCFCSDKCFENYKVEVPETSVVKYKRKEEK